MSTLLLVPLEDIVVFPNMTVTLTVEVGSEERVLLVPRHENEYSKVGTVAEVVDRLGQLAELGVEEVIGTVGGLPFQVADLEDVELIGAEVAAALR